VVLWDNGANGFAMGNTMDSSSIQSLLNSSTTSSLSSLSSLSNMSSLIGRGAEGSSILAKFLEGQAGVTIAKVACGDLFTGNFEDARRDHYTSPPKQCNHCISFLISKVVVTRTILPYLEMTCLS
jgi:hypothetical protein